MDVGCSMLKAAKSLADMVHAKANNDTYAFPSYPWILSP